MIRAAEIADVDALLLLESECFANNPWSRGLWAAEFTSGRHVFVADTGERVIGLVAVRTSGAESELLRIAVRPQHQGRGIAASLMEVAQANARSVGASTMFLEVEHDNVAALALYGDTGFRTVARRNNYYGTGRHAEIMTCDLQEASA
jgi:ribosomal-protein-alanine N-acetyltransferase